ncbi:hypothetical protein AX14_001442 [Amanita brunnescens Koide BX004]|nr:hypothetical protein AX14_001442 [Amanita brunnescens Koide BX004]
MVTASLPAQPARKTAGIKLHQIPLITLQSRSQLRTPYSITPVLFCLLDTSAVAVPLSPLSKIRSGMSSWGSDGTPSVTSSESYSTTSNTMLNRLNGYWRKADKGDTIMYINPDGTLKIINGHPKRDLVAGQWMRAQYHFVSTSLQGVGLPKRTAITFSPQLADDRLEITCTLFRTSTCTARLGNPTIQGVSPDPISVSFTS